MTAVVDTADQEAERLAKLAANAETKAQEARQRAAEASRRAEERRAAQRHQIQRERLQAYDEAALTAYEQAARERFRAAVLGDERPFTAFVEWQTATQVRYELSTEAASIHARLHPDAARLPTASLRAMTFADAVERILVDEIERRAAEWRQEREVELL